MKEEEEKEEEEEETTTTNYKTLEFIYVVKVPTKAAMEVQYLPPRRQSRHGIRKVGAKVQDSNIIS